VRAAVAQPEHDVRVLQDLAHLVLVEVQQRDAPAHAQLAAQRQVEHQVHRVHSALARFEYACASTTWAKGELVGPVENTAGDALEKQSVVKVTNPLYAIGRCAKGGTSLTKVQVELMPYNANLTTVTQQVADT
jgi:hypothetical protein